MSGILGKTVAVTRFNVSVPPEGPDFERARFWEIEPGSEVRERMGFVPFELDAPWEAAQGRYVFRMRIDRIRPDATAVKERIRELIKVEMEATGRSFVGPKTRKKLRELAEVESTLGQRPKTTIVEAVIDGALLYVGSTSKSHLGLVATLLRQAGVEAELKAPWLDIAPEAEESSDIVLPRSPGESVLGCRFMRFLLEDPEVMVEPEAGMVKLATREGRVSLSGSVLNDLHRYLDDGAEILAAKIHVGVIPIRFESVSYRFTARLEPPRADHWMVALDDRLEQLAGLYQALDAKYERFAQGQAASPVEGAL